MRTPRLSEIFIATGLNLFAGAFPPSARSQTPERPTPPATSTKRFFGSRQTISFYAYPLAIAYNQLKDAPPTLVLRTSDLFKPDEIFEPEKLGVENLPNMCPDTIQMFRELGADQADPKALELFNTLQERFETLLQQQIDQGLATSEDIESIKSSPNYKNYLQAIFTSQGEYSPSNITFLNSTEDKALNILIMPETPVRNEDILELMTGIPATKLANLDETDPYHYFKAFLIHELKHAERSKPSIHSYDLCTEININALNLDQTEEFLADFAAFPFMGHQTTQRWLHARAVAALTANPNAAFAQQAGSLAHMSIDFHASSFAIDIDPITKEANAEVFSFQAPIIPLFINAYADTLASHIENLKLPEKSRASGFPSSVKDLFAPKNAETFNQCAQMVSTKRMEGMNDLTYHYAAVLWLKDAGAFDTLDIPNLEEDEHFPATVRNIIDEYLAGVEALSPVTAEEGKKLLELLKDEPTTGINWQGVADRFVLPYINGNTVSPVPTVETSTLAAPAP